MKNTNAQVFKMALDAADLSGLTLIYKRCRRFYFLLTGVYAIVYIAILLMLSLQYLVIARQMPLSAEPVILGILLLMVYLLRLLHRKAGRFRGHYRRLKKDRQTWQKTVVKGKLLAAYAGSDALVYQVEDTLVRVQNYQLLLGWQVQVFQCMENQEIALHFLPESRLLLGAYYPGIPPNTTETKPLTEAQVQAMAAADQQVQVMDIVTGTVTEIIMGLYVNPVLSMRGMGSSRFVQVRLGNDLYQWYSEKIPVTGAVSKLAVMR
jgi:hypothetical protein